MLAHDITSHLARVPLAFLPTPLHDLPNLQAVLPNAPRIFIKRDDQTGLATGGNKTRKLEFLMADALAQGADVVITVGGAQSNHARQTVAAAVKYGIKCALVLSGDAIPREQWGGNLLLDDLMGADVHFAAGRERVEVVAEIAGQLREQGAHPYVIPTGGSVPLGAAGYAEAVEELAAQCDAQNIDPDQMIVVAGSGGTMAGILVGARAVMPDVQVLGMNNYAIDDIHGTVLQVANDTAELLNIDSTFTADDVRIVDAVGPHAYGVITPAERDAIRLLARTEGIILDPVYTGRAFAQFMADVRAGMYRPYETVIFWHTGGVAGAFPRAAELTILDPRE